MPDKFRAEVKRRFDQTFGIERLELFSEDIQKLENDGDSATAGALRDLLKEQFSKGLKIEFTDTKSKTS